MDDTTFSKYLNGRPFAHADRVSEIRMGTPLLRVDFYQVEVIPYAINEIAQTAWI
jgi:hypothetical protein